MSCTYSQQVKVDKNGNYISATNSSKADTINTGKTFTDSKGLVYPVYKSAKGKLYYPRISKSGTYYRVYLKIN